MVQGIIAVDQSNPGWVLLDELPHLLVPTFTVGALVVAVLRYFQNRMLGTYPWMTVGCDALLSFARNLTRPGLPVGWHPDQQSYGNNPEQPDVDTKWSWVLRSGPQLRPQRPQRPRANSAQGPVAFLLPLRGVSILDGDDQPFCDRAADAALFETIRNQVRADIPVLDCDANINDPAFAREAVKTMLALIAGRSPSATSPQEPT